jgi:hypothetical protein
MAITRIQSSLADSTFTTYRSAWLAFFRFLLAYEWSPLPPQQELFVRYAVWLWLNGYSYATIRTYLGALPSLYIAVGVELSLAQSSFPALARCLRGIRRALSAPKSKAHLTIENLVSFRKFVDLRDLKQLACWTALCVGFFSFLRSGNLVPKLKGAWKPGTNLARRDVRFVERGAVLYLRFTKTSQFDGPPIAIPIPFISGACFCPVIALKCLFALVRTSDSSPLFSFGPSSWITYSDLRIFIRSLAEKCGLDPSEYGCHSARSGGATFASAVGGSAFHIKLQGLWKSDAYLRYLHLSVDQRWSLPSLMAAAAASRSLM